MLYPPTAARDDWVIHLPETYYIIALQTKHSTILSAKSESSRPNAYLFKKLRQSFRVNHAHIVSAGWKSEIHGNRVETQSSDRGLWCVVGPRCPRLGAVHGGHRRLRIWCWSGIGEFRCREFPTPDSLCWPGPASAGRSTAAYGKPLLVQRIRTGRVRGDQASRWPRRWPFAGAGNLPAARS